MIARVRHAIGIYFVDATTPGVFGMASARIAFTSRERSDSPISTRTISIPVQNAGSSSRRPTNYMTEHLAVFDLHFDRRANSESHGKTGADSRLRHIDNLTRSDPTRYRSRSPPSSSDKIIKFGITGNPSKTLTLSVA